MIKGGPKIINDGLVLCLDAHDAKSYAGEPVTNLYGDISTSTALRPNRTEYNTSGTWTTDMPMCPENVGRVYKHTSGALTSSWSGNSYGYMLKDIATTSGETYIVTCWVYVSSDCNISGCPVVIEQEASGESTVSGYDGGYDLNNKGTWQLLAKKCVADDLVRFIPLYPSRNGVTDGSFSGFFAWGGAQVVKASYVTPYVLSSRSATNGWLDRTGNSTGGTLVNGVNTGVSHYRAGQVIMPVSASYLRFDGSDDKIQVDNIPQIFDGSVTMESWFFWDDDTRSVIFGNYNQGAGGHDVNFEKLTSRVLRIYWNRGERDVTTSANAVTTSGEWQHVVMVRDASNDNFKFYVNGSLIQTTSNAGSDITSTGSTFRIGADTRDGTTVTNGGVGVLRLYSKALTAAEVLSNYNATKERFT